MLNIDGSMNKSPKMHAMPVLRLGFRPFFLGAAMSAVLLMLLWMAQFVFGRQYPLTGLSPVLWHAHEMLFGYTAAVIAGFLLTAIRNWTGITVLTGWSLAGLFAVWLLARLAPFIPGISLAWLAVLNAGFLTLLALICLRPVLKARQYKQTGIIAKLFLLALSNLVFFLGLTGVLADGVQWGLYSALYIILALILMMMRRVMPMFIQNGIDGEFEPRNRKWLDISSLFLLLALWLADVFTRFDAAVAWLALVLAVLHGLRLRGWYTSRIWSKPLVWVLVVAYGFIVFGFALLAASVLSASLYFIAIHAFTVGGIGLVTLGMMSRVALGHTGRNVFEPPALLRWMFLCLLAAAVVRTVLPLFDMTRYVYWIGASQLLWAAAFILFLLVYAPMLLRARIDGSDG